MQIKTTGSSAAKAIAWAAITNSEIIPQHATSILEGWVTVVQIDLVNPVKDLGAQRREAESLEVFLELFDGCCAYDRRPGQHPNKLW